MLEMERWATRAPLADCVFENRWPDAASSTTEPPPEVLPD